IVVNPTTIRLATSRANAVAGTTLDLTSAGTSSAQSFQAVTEQAAETIAPSAVTTDSDTNSVDFGFPHGFSTRPPGIYDATNGTAIEGLQPGRVYYAIVDANKPTRLKLAASSADAAAGTPITLTSTGTATLQTITKVDLGATATLTGATVRRTSDANTI